MKQGGGIHSACGGDDVSNASSLRYRRAGDELWTFGFCRINLDSAESKWNDKEKFSTITGYVKRLLSAVLNNKDEKFKEQVKKVLGLEGLFHRFKYTKKSRSKNDRNEENISMEPNGKRFNVQFDNAGQFLPFFNGLREAVSIDTVPVVIEMNEVIGFFEDNFARYSRILLTPSAGSGSRSPSTGSGTRSLLVQEHVDDQEEEEEVFKGFSITLSILFSLGETLPSEDDEDYDTKMAPLRQADHQDYDGIYIYKNIILLLSIHQMIVLPIEIGAFVGNTQQTYEQSFTEMRGMSVPMVSKQSPTARIQWQRLPIVAVVSLDEDERPGQIGVYPCSHKEPLQDTSGKQILYARIVEYRSNEMILLDPQTVHFGCPYPEDNIRAHIYTNNPDFIRSVYDKETGDYVTITKTNISYNSLLSTGGYYTITSTTPFKRSDPTVPPEKQQQSATNSRLAIHRESSKSMNERMNERRKAKQEKITSTTPFKRSDPTVLPEKQQQSATNSRLAIHREFAKSMNERMKKLRKAKQEKSGKETSGGVNDSEDSGDGKE